MVGLCTVSGMSLSTVYPHPSCILQGCYELDVDITVLRVNPSAMQVTHQEYYYYYH